MHICTFLHQNIKIVVRPDTLHEYNVCTAHIFNLYGSVSCYIDLWELYVSSIFTHLLALDINTWEVWLCLFIWAMVDMSCLLTILIGGGGPIMGDLWALKGLLEEGTLLCLHSIYWNFTLYHGIWCIEAETFCSKFLFFFHLKQVATCWSE